MPGARVVQERVDPRALSVNIAAASGQYRWGPDEQRGRNVPTGISITTQIPGGFGQFSAALVRRSDLSYSDLDRFAPCTVTGAGGSLVAFDGYLSAAPMNRDTGYSIVPNAIGWAGEMKDNTSFTMVYIDRILSKWGSPSTAEQIALLTGSPVNNFGAWSSSSAPDHNGQPTLFFTAQQPITNPASQNQVGEAWYDAGAGNLISKYAFSAVVGSFPGIAGGGVSLILRASSDDHQTATIGSGNYAPAGNSFPQPGATGTFTPSYRYVDAFVKNTSTINSTNGATAKIGFANLYVMGPHGLTVHAGASGSTPSYDDGIYGGDLVADIITRTCPHLTVARGMAGAVVYQDTFPVPQCAFNQPVDADTAVQQVNQCYLYDYGVYENRAFFWRPPATGRTWYLRVGDGVQLQMQGPQIETAFNGVVVQFTDAAGVTRYVGPPGSGFDWTSSLLQDTTPTNPCNIYGRQCWALVTMGTTVQTVAIQMGAVFLQTTLSRPSSGTMTVTGVATDSTGREWPVWMIRAGDTAILQDTNDQTPHYVLSTNYSHDQLQNQITVDAPPNKLDWLLSRLGLSLSAIG